MPQAGEIFSNLKRTTVSYDEELAVSQATLDHYNSLPKDGESTTQMIEAEQEAYELAYAAAEPQRWEGQERWQGRENVEMRLANILHPHAVFAKLRRAGVDARTESPTYYVWGIDDDTGKRIAIKKQRNVGRMWLHDESVRGRLGISAWVPDLTTGRRVVKWVAALQYPYGPEWSVMGFNEWNVPTVERYRGWRTALLQMILKDVITEEEVDRAFGPVALNPASELYRKQIQRHRAMRKGLMQ
jgi:hypothetical protein